MAKKTVLITGGAGTVGSAFIKTYSHQYHLAVYGRNQAAQIALQKQYPEIVVYEGSIEDREKLIEAVKIAQPDIIIHAAALKRMDVAEQNPSNAIKVNLLGSMHVIDASRAGRPFLGYTILPISSLPQLLFDRIIITEPIAVQDVGNLLQEYGIGEDRLIHME